MSLQEIVQWNTSLIIQEWSWEKFILLWAAQPVQPVFSSLSSICHLCVSSECFNMISTGMVMCVRVCVCLVAECQYWYWNFEGNCVFSFCVAWLYLCFRRWDERLHGLQSDDQGELCQVMSVVQRCVAMSKNIKITKVSTYTVCMYTN